MANKKPTTILWLRVYRKPTRIRKQERWGIRMVAGNNEVIMSGEKYHNHVDALRTANLIANGTMDVVDEADVG